MFDSTKKFDSTTNEFQNLACRMSSNKIVIYKSNHTRKLTLHQEEQAKINFEKKEYNGYMSRATKAYLTKILDTWFLTTRYYNCNLNIKNKLPQRKMVFLTLTLPSKQTHSDKEIKRECLNKFLISLTKTGKIDSYFWRAEAQKNGNIHFHLLIDKYLPKEELQKHWNNCLISLGYIDEFEKKFSHRNPPTTHIEQIPSNQTIIEYVIKYVGKSESDRKIEGRIWGMSDKLRELKSFNKDLDIQSEKTINKYINDDNKNVYQDENCMVVIIPFEKRLEYLKDCEKLGLNETMKANANYLYLDGCLPIDILFPKRVKHVSITIDKKPITQFQLFEVSFNNCEF